MYDFAADIVCGPAGHVLATYTLDTEVKGKASGLRPKLFIANLFICIQ